MFLKPQSGALALLEPDAPAPRPEARNDLEAEALVLQLKTEEARFRARGVAYLPTRVKKEA